MITYHTCEDPEQLLSDGFSGVMGCRVFYSRQLTAEWFAEQAAKSLGTPA